HGLAGARVGYAIGCAPLIAAFDRVRNHFGMSRISQAGALAALRDGAHLQSTCTAIARSRARIADIAAQAGLRALPSATNFVAIDCGQDGDFARDVLSDLIAAGVFVRMPFVSPQDRCIRVSCGPEPEIAVFAQALGPALAAARAKREARHANAQPAG
ncbi:MAG: aminotransferase class I/II-fold pyridoxal phosphate-dependent enzyme, partial [Pseudomonadota bacterium]